MDAVVNTSHEPGSVELREVSDPRAERGEVVMAVEAVGVCGSDVHQWNGKASWLVEPPVILGHEFGGRVVAVGPDVSTDWLERRVVSETAASLPDDSPYLRIGAYNIEPQRRGFGALIDGAMAERVRVPVRCLHRIPDSLPMVMAALTEPLCVAYHATLVRGGVRAGDTVLVIGPGPIGLLSTWLARRAGAGRVLLAGLPQAGPRLTFARQLGAHYSATRADEALQQVRSVGDGYGAHLTIDAAGVTASLTLALDATRNGGVISKVGWGRDPFNASLDPLVAKSIDLRGSFSHTWDTWERCIALLADHWRDLIGLVGWTGPLADWETGFQAFASGQVVKPVILPQGRGPANVEQLTAAEDNRPG